MAFQPIPIGTKYNKWTVIGPPVPMFSEQRMHHPIQCECGNLSWLRGYKIETASYSCSKGTCHKDYVHGQTHKSPLLHVWYCMRNRCYFISDINYINYGGRGIVVSEEWLTFINFHNDMIDTYRKGLQLDRRDNNGNYCKENCHWVTSSDNCKNRRSTRLITYDGRTQCLKDWAAEIGISSSGLSDRFTAGLSIEEALTVPLHRRSNQSFKPNSFNLW